MKKFSIISLICGALLILSSLFIPAFSLLIASNNTSAVGIIGGADSPTLRFMLNQMIWKGCWFVALQFGIVILLTGIVSLIFRKPIANNCSIKTSLLSLLISTGGGLGFSCLITRFFMGNHIELFPIQYPCCIVFGYLSLIFCILFLMLYIREILKSKKYKSIIFDFLTVVLYFFPFAFLFVNLIDKL